MTKKKKTGSGVGVRARLRAEASIGPPVSWKIGEGIQTWGKTHQKEGRTRSGRRGADREETQNSNLG